MGKSRISWTDYTFNPWWGCSRVSPGCLNCYADATAKRYGHSELWRRSGPRRTFTDNYWRNPLRWNAKAQAAGTIFNVFTSSMADVFEIHPDPKVNAVLDDARARLWQLIDVTPFLIWQLLTKRLPNVRLLVPWGDRWPANVWLGTSVEDMQRAYERLGTLVHYDAEIAARFVSVEPQTEPVHLAPWLKRGHSAGINLAFVGGESGAGARPFDLSWARDIRDQVADSDAAFFFKQTGTVLARELGLTGKGEEFDELPADLRIREFPAAYHDRLITAHPTTTTGAIR